MSLRGRHGFSDRERAMRLGKSRRKQELGGRGERMVLRAVLVLGLVATAGLWCLMRGVGERESLVLPGLVGLTVVAGVNWFGRVRARERWEAAWDAYVADEDEDGGIETADEEEAELVLAGSR